MDVEAVAYIRISTDEQNPKNQLLILEQYAREKGYRIVKVYEEHVSGVTNPLERPVFKDMLDFARRNGIKAILMHDITRFYRSESPTEALSLLKQITKEFFVDFAREPEIPDPMLKELWSFIKSWFASYERLQISARTKAGILRLKKEGKLFHRPTILHYFAATLFNKQISELTEEDLEKAKRQFVSIVSKYWYDKRFKKHQIAFILKDYEEIFKKMYNRFPNAPTSYNAFWRIMKSYHKN